MPKYRMTFTESVVYTLDFESEAELPSDPDTGDGIQDWMDALSAAIPDWHERGEVYERDMEAFERLPDDADVSI